MSQLNKKGERKMKTLYKTKGALSCLLLLSIVVSIVSPLALAAGPGAQSNYIGLFVGTCGFDIGSFGISNAACTAHLKQGYSATAKLSIMQSSDGISWSLYKDWSSSESTYISMDQYWAVIPGYFYKAVMGLTVYDSDHNIVEYIEIDSPIQYY